MAENSIEVSTCENTDKSAGLAAFKDSLQWRKES